MIIDETFYEERQGCYELTRVHHVDGNTVRVRVYRDFYGFQRHAVAEVLTPAHLDNDGELTVDPVVRLDSVGRCRRHAPDPCRGLTARAGTTHPLPAHLKKMAAAGHAIHHTGPPRFEVTEAGIAAAGTLPPPSARTGSAQPSTRRKPVTRPNGELYVPRLSTRPPTGAPATFTPSPPPWS
jgi:hypothetical protein